MVGTSGDRARQVEATRKLLADAGGASDEFCGSHARGELAEVRIYAPKGLSGDSDLGMW